MGSKTQPPTEYHTVPDVPTDLHEAALYWLSLGFSVIPVDIEKRPTLKSWKRWQTERPTPEQLSQWFTGNGKVAGLAIITGQVSGNLIVLDFDSLEDYAILVREHVELAATYTVRTSRGYHAYLFVDELPKSQTIQTNGKVWCEVKAGGCCITAPPSQHQSGHQYTTRVKCPITRVPNLDAILPKPKEKPVGPLPSAAYSDNPNPTLSSKVKAALLQRGKAKPYRDGLLVRCPCPVHQHGDRNPSAVFNEQGGFLWCFASQTAYTLKDAAGMLGIDASEGWAWPESQERPAKEPDLPPIRLHRNLAVRYAREDASKRPAVSLLMLLDAWLIANGAKITTVSELAEWAYSIGWAYTPDRIRHLIRQYGDKLGIVRDGHTLLLPSLRMLSNRCGLDRPGPAFTISRDAPSTLDPSSRAGAARLRTALFDADRDGKETGANWRAQKLGYKSRQTTYRHAIEGQTIIHRGPTHYLTPGQAQSSQRKPHSWWARREDGHAHFFPAEEPTPQAIPKAMTDWLGEQDALYILAFYQEASRYETPFTEREGQNVNLCNPSPSEIRGKGQDLRVFGASECVLVRKDASVVADEARLTRLKRQARREFWEEQHWRMRNVSAAEAKAGA